MARVNVVDEEGNVVKQYYLDDKLEEKIVKHILPCLNQKDEDYVIVVDGHERVGKSTFAMQLGKRIDPTLNLSRLCFSPDEFKNQILSAKKGQCVIFDEAYRGLSSRGALTEVNRILVSLMSEMGQKNLCVIIVLPTFFLLEKYVALWRARGLFHIYKKNGRKGYWVGFGRKKKKLIYLKGKKDYTYNLKIARSRFKGRFYGKYVVDEEAYRTKKKKSLNEGFTTTIQEKFKEQRDKLVYLIKREMNISQRDMQKIFKEYDVGMKRTAIGNILRNIKKNS